MRQRLSFYAYCVLTPLIIALAWLRERVTAKAAMTRRHDRTFYAGTSARWACCDCGLEHITYPLFGEESRERAFRFVPVRIKGYDYRLRHGSGGSSPSVDESGRDAWTGEPKPA